MARGLRAQVPSSRSQIRRRRLRTGPNELALRPPLIPIRALWWILPDDSMVELAQRKKFLGIITRDALKQESGAGHSGGMILFAPAQGGNKWPRKF
jgi:hypothetical protein